MLQASQETVEAFAEDVGLLWCPSRTIAVLSEPPTSLQFLRDHVAPSRPCIIQRAIPTRGTVSLDSVALTHADLRVTVDATPDGHGDSIRRVAHGKVFVQPAQRTMTMVDFRNRMRLTQQQAIVEPQMIHEKIFSICSMNEGDHDTRDFGDDDAAAVLYYSRQNDCLRTELESVWHDCGFPETIPWAAEAFGTETPEAVNLWIGNQHAVSAMHKDHYENLFYVCSGEKVFTLCPPADAPFLYEREHESGRFVQAQDSSWYVCVEAGHRVPWVAADVTRKDDPTHAAEFPLLRFTHPIEVRVQAGEMLYLPALWFHRVTQTCETVAINYWYGMRFDSPSWCYFHLLQQLRPASDGNDS